MACRAEQNYFIFHTFKCEDLGQFCKLLFWLHPYDGGVRWSTAQTGREPEDLQSIKDSPEKMELQDQLKGDWSRYFCNQPPVEFDKSSVRPWGNSDPYCSIWTDAEQTRFKNCNNRSFAMDARIRLDSLKSGCNSPSPCRALDSVLDNYKDPWDSEESQEEESQEEESALDSVELLDVDDTVQDEENW